MKERFHAGLVAAVTHQIARRTLAEHHPERIQKDRLARARLAREQVQARPEREPDLLNEREVFDGNFR